MSDKNISRWMSLILRHDPAKAGLTLDAGGWTSVDALIAAAPMALDRGILDRVVAENAKKRFAYSEDGSRIRAQQGHSIQVDLGLEARTPPNTLFHGTATKTLAAIQDQGILPQGRHHVHLSVDRDTALNVGQRHGKPIILGIDTARMFQDGHLFFRSGNGVWLTDKVPAPYLTVLP